MLARQEPMDQNESAGHYKALYHMLLNAMPSSVLIFDRQLRIVSANRNFLEKSHRHSENTVGRRLNDVFPEIILKQIDIEKQIEQVFIENQPLPGQRISYRAPGIPLRIYYYRILPYATHDKVDNAILIMEDVTEQMRLSKAVRRIENHLASVISSANDIMISTDSKGCIVSWNPAAEKIIGLPWSLVQKKPFFDLCASEAKGKVEALWRDTLKGNVAPITEWDMVTQADQIVRVSWVCSPLKDEGGQSSGVVAVGRDLTEQRKLELQLIQSQKLTALGVMAGGIAHQVRNPLAICSSAAQFLEDDTAAPEWRKNCAAKIHSNIRKASTIIENLLKFARPTNGIEKAMVNIAELIQEVLELINHQAQLQKIKIEIVPPPREVFVNGNSDLLQQSIVNIILNAIQAMPDGGHMRISTKLSQSQVILIIKDTGYGIPKEDLNNVFDPFYTHTMDSKGTGLGLSISYAIIHLHAGEILAESEIGKGSIFKILLPKA